MTEELEAAINYIKTCRQLYPERDLMDEETVKMYEHCWSIVHKAQQPQPIKPKVKKKGKLELFEEDVIECLKQGWGEERQLLEEAENRKNPYARRNYINAYWRAVNRFNRGK